MKIPDVRGDEMGALLTRLGTEMQRYESENDGSEIKLEYRNQYGSLFFFFFRLVTFICKGV